MTKKNIRLFCLRYVLAYYDRKVRISDAWLKFYITIRDKVATLYREEVTYL